MVGRQDTMGRSENVTSRELKVWTEGKLEVVNTKLKSFGRSLDEVRHMSNNTITQARTAFDLAEETSSKMKKVESKADRAHECQHDITLTRIRADVNSWTNWWKKTMFIVVGAVVVGAGGIVTWLMLHNSLSADVERMQTDVQRLNSNMDSVVQSQTIIQSALRKKDENELAEKAQRIEEVKRALESVLDRDIPVKKRKR